MSPKYLAELMYGMWMSSEAHQQAMMRENLREVYLGVSITEKMFDQGTGDYHDWHLFLGFLSVKIAW